MHPISAELTLPGIPASVPRARHFVTDQLEAWGLDGVAYTAALCVSELATNVALHAKTSFTISLCSVDSETLRVELHDGSSRTPRLRTYDEGATTGRGLRILDELTRDWGCTVEESGGKTVWLLIDAPASTGAGTGDLEASDDEVAALLDLFDDVDDVDDGTRSPLLAA